MSYSTTASCLAPVATKTMISQIEHSVVRFSEFESDVRISTLAVPTAFVPPLPAMVPPESHCPMRRQPTPVLFSPFRWSIWSAVMQALSSVVRHSRYTLGYERD